MDKKQQETVQEQVTQQQERPSRESIVWAIRFIRNHARNVAASKQPA